MKTKATLILALSLVASYSYGQKISKSKRIVIEELDKKNGRYVLANKLTSPTEQFPVYERRGSKIFAFPDTVGIDSGGLNSEVAIYYQRKPIDPKWTYLVASGQSVFNPSDASFQDFELPEYFFDRIVVEIALFAGVHLKEQQVVQVMNQEQADSFQKQNLN